VLNTKAASVLSRGNAVYLEKESSAKSDQQITALASMDRKLV
jgi:hypothetical protein